MTLHSLSWSSSEVDATTGDATNTLTFAISGYTESGHVRINLEVPDGKPAVYVFAEYGWG